MRFAFSQKLFLLAATAFAALPLLSSSEIGLPFQIALVVGWLAAWFIGAPVTANRTYRHIVTGSLLFVTAIQVARVVLTIPMAMGAMELIAALLAAKLVDRAAASDDYQIVVLSFLHLIAATVAMDEILFGLCFLGFTACATPALAMTHLRQEMESRFGEGSKQPNAGRVLERLFGSKRVVTPGFLLGSSLLSVPVLLLTGLLFILFPRFGMGFMGRLRATEETVGFGDTMSLSDADISNLEDTVLIRFEPAEKLPSPPSTLPIRLRAAVLESFDGNTWTRNDSQKWHPVELTNRGYRFTPDDAPAVMEMDVLIEAMNPKRLPLPEGTGFVAPDPTVDRQGNFMPRLLVMNDAGEIEYEDKSETGIRYRVSITGASPPGRSPSVRGDTLKLFDGADRLVQTATTLAGNGTAATRAERLVNALKTRYRYALKVADAPTNALESTSLYRFLYARKTGSCEHFATALTLMLRAVGIPARLVTGFSGAEYNPIGEFYAVRQKFAHAWTEAFINGRWVTLDAVPSADGDDLFQRPGFFALLFDTLKMQWRKRVVSYDLAAQEKFAAGLLRSLNGRPGKRTHESLRRIAAGISVTALLLAAWLVLLRRFRRKSAVDPTSARIERKRRAVHKEAARILAALDRRLSKLGIPRTANATPEAHLRTVRETVAFSKSEATRILQRYNEVRFGNGTFAQGELKSLLASAKRLGRNA